MNLKKIVSLCALAISAFAITESQEAGARPRAPNNNGGFQKCWDRCVDSYLDCQLSHPEGSLDRALCDQKFDRCSSFCDWIHRGGGVVVR